MIKRAIFIFMGGVAVSVVPPIAGSPTAAQQTPSQPDFAVSCDTAWDGIGGGELYPVPGSPKPVTQDPRYHYTPNGPGQASYRIADLTNPNLKPWVKEAMKKDNDEVLAGKIGYTPRHPASRRACPASWPWVAALFLSFSRPRR